MKSIYTCKECGNSQIEGCLKLELNTTGFKLDRPLYLPKYGLRLRIGCGIDKAGYGRIQIEEVPEIIGTTCAENYDKDE